MEALSGLRARVHEVEAQQVTELRVIPGGVEVTHDEVAVAVPGELSDHVQPLVPEVLRPAYRRVWVDAHHAHVEPANLHGSRGHRARVDR